MTNLPTYLLLLALAAPATPPTDRPANLLGGRMLALRDQGGRVTLGYPDLEVAWHMPLAAEVEIAPRLRWAFHRAFQGRHNALMGGAEARVGLRRVGPFELAAIGAADVQWHTSGDGHLALGLGWPGLAATWRPLHRLDVDFGVQLQDTLHLGQQTGLDLFVAAFGAVEWGLGGDLAALARVEIGPDIRVFGGRTDVTGHARFVCGASWMY